jgi:hypothetical protein
MYIPCILYSLLYIYAFVGLDNKILQEHSYDNAIIVTLFAILQHNA